MSISIGPEFNMDSDVMSEPAKSSTGAAAAIAADGETNTTNEASGPTSPTAANTCAASDKVVSHHRAETIIGTARAASPESADLVDLGFWLSPIASKTGSKIRNSSRTDY